MAARLLTVGTPQSPLAEVAVRTGGVHVPVAAPATPAARASRMALWALLTPVLVAADVLGLVDTSPTVLSGVADRLDTNARRSGRRRRRSSTRPRRSPSRSPASVPVVLGDGDVTGVAASRAVSMLARTARVPAMRGALPDDAGRRRGDLRRPVRRPARTTSSPTRSSTTPPAARLRLVFLRDAVPTVDRPDGAWLETSRTADAVRLTAAGGGGADQ